MCMFEGSTDVELYVKILETIILKFIFPNTCRFMHDNPKHTSKKVREFMQINARQ